MMEPRSVKEQELEKLRTDNLENIQFGWRYILSFYINKETSLLVIMVVSLSNKD